MADNLDDKGEWTEISVRIPPELKGYGASLKRFFDAMVYKLRRNAHKGKWEKVEIGSAIAAIKNETSELEHAVNHGNTTEIILEGADVANQALIVAEIALEARGL